MKIGETLIVKQKFYVEDGYVPCGSVMQIKSIINYSKILITVTPFVYNGERLSKDLFLDKKFIESYTTT